MDKSLYELMQELLDEKGNDSTQNIEYLGRVLTNEKDSSGTDIQVIHDLFRLIEKFNDGSTFEKYVLENGDLVGISKDGDNIREINPRDNSVVMEDTSFLGQLEALSQGKTISLNELDTKLEKIAKAIGIEKSQILAMSETDLKQKISEKVKDVSGNEGAQIVLDDQNRDDDELTQQNQEALFTANMSSKTQEIDLNQKIDDRHSLYEVMGVPQGTTLVALYSDAIANNPNTTRFSHVFIYPDGSIHPTTDVLTQVGGTHSDKNIYETNRDGSKIEELTVQSTYSINSSIVKNAILTTRIDNMGYIELGYGEMDRTSHRDAFTQHLETERTRYTTKAVRDEFSKGKGIDNIPDKLDEAKGHDCGDLTLAEADGNPNTGHVDSYLVADEIMSDESVGEIISSHFSKEEVASRYEELERTNKGRDKVSIKEMTKYSLTDEAYKIDHPSEISQELDEHNLEHSHSTQG